MAPKVLIHGVPETEAIWDHVRSHLDGDVHTLALPGFDAPRPDDFGATMDEYADWLVAQLAAFDEPVDLVGHDWGGILSARVASWSPGSLRSWVSDAAGSLVPTYRWHDLALLWQTPGAGEDFWEGMMIDSYASAEILSGYDIPMSDALVMTAALDRTMADSILALYRSADGIGEKWAFDGPVATPGMLLVGEHDPFGDVDAAAALATTIV